MPQKKKVLENEAFDIGLRFKVSYYVALPILIVIILFVAGYLLYTQVISPDDVVETTAAIIKGVI